VIFTKVLAGSKMKISSVSGVNLRKIAPEDLSIIERWYGMADCLSFATGNKSFAETNQMFVNPNRYNKLVLMIETLIDKQTIGFIYGETKNIQARLVLWINIFIIDPAYQNQGFGTYAINKLLNLIRTRYGSLTCYVAVSEENIQGLSFWQKAGFIHSSGMEESLNQKGPSHVAILKRDIK
jgi:ribosomal protein S18 acetylase RimI-like enzyme